MRLRASDLQEGVGIPLEVDLLELVPEAIDPYLGRGSDDAEAEAVRLAAEIQESVQKIGLWLSKDRRKVVTRARSIFGGG
jgi:hypothetical protein